MFNLFILLPGIWAIVYYLYFQFTGQVSTAPDYDGELLDVPLAKKSRLKK